MTIQAFLDSDAGKAVYATLVLAGADLALGIAAAFRDGTFRLDSLAAYLRKHIAGRVAPIGLLLGLGYFGHVDALTTIGFASAALYAAETVGSIRTSWGSGHAEQAVPND